MKIGIIFTGGTIGSVVNDDGYIAVDSSEKYTLLDMYYNEFGKASGNEFVIRTPYSILSENLSFENIIKLKQIIDEIKNDVECIIVLHGTDTLQYTAGFLNCMAVTEIPIILVSSAYVLSDSRANGFENFKLALKFANVYRQGGVFVSYVNTDGRRLIHAADKLLAHSSFISDLYSINGEYYAEEISGKIEINKDCRYTVNNTEIHEITKKVLFVHVYPEMNAAVNISAADIILIEAYHSGTVSVDNAMHEIAKRAFGDGIKIYIVGISSDAVFYETVKKYEELGMIPLYDRAPIDAFCRLSCGAGIVE